MNPVSLDAALLRRQLPELILRPGMSVVARVASRGAGPAGALVLAGQLLKATLPDEVRAGDTLRLIVAETSPERVVLRLVGATPDPAAAAAHAAQAAAPDSGEAAPAPAPPPIPGSQPLPPAFAPGPPPPLAPRDADPDAPGEHGRGRSGGERAGVNLAYETPALGRLDIRLERGPEGITATIGAGATAYALAHARAEALREALEARLGVPAAVRVNPRREPFDAYA